MMAVARALVAVALVVVGFGIATFGPGTGDEAANSLIAGIPTSDSRGATVRVPGYTRRAETVTVPQGTVVLLELHVPAGPLLVMTDFAEESIPVDGPTGPDTGITERELAPVIVDLPDGIAVDQDADDGGAFILGEDNSRDVVEADELISGERNLTAAEIDRVLQVRLIADTTDGVHPVTIRGLAGYPPVEIVITDDELAVPLEPRARMVAGEPIEAGGPYFGSPGESFVQVNPHQRPYTRDWPGWDTMPVGGTIHYPGDRVTLQIGLHNLADPAGNNSRPLPDDAEEGQGYFDGPAVARAATYSIHIPPDGVAVNRMDVAVRIGAANAATASAITHLHLAEPAGFVVDSDDTNFVRRDILDWDINAAPVGYGWDDDRRLAADDLEDAFDGARFVEAGNNFSFLISGQFTYDAARAGTELPEVLTPLDDEDQQ